MGGGGLLLLALLLAAAGAGAAGDSSFLDIFKTVDTPYDNRAIRQVQPVVQPTVLAREEYLGGSFRVLARKAEVKRYRCSSCHTCKEVQAKNAFAMTHGQCRH